LKKAREKKELSKHEELKTKWKTKLTQEAATLDKTTKKQLNDSGKKLMKKMNDIVQKEHSIEESQDSTEPKTSKKRKVTLTETTPMEEPQGLRHVPKASDDYGCTHKGLWELTPLPKDYLATYTKTGAWLHQRPCKDCVNKPEDDTGKVMDVTDLLKTKGRPDVAYYCNTGATGHNMPDNDVQWKQQWLCDMVLCNDCYDKRMTNMGSGNKRTRRNQ
jgi:hypothetical protein